MNKQQTNTRLHIPCIDGNKQGAVIKVDKGDSIDNPLFTIGIRQLEVGSENGRKTTSYRKATMHGELEDLLDMEFFEGKNIPGKIRVIESYTPFDSSNHEAYIKYDKLGNIVRLNGRVVYRLEEWVYDPEEEDQLINE